MSQRKEQKQLIRAADDTSLVRRIMQLDCALFEGFEEHEIRQFLDFKELSVVKTHANHLIRQQGSAQDDFGLILSGLVEIRQYDEQGTVFTMGLLESGELFGEMTAFNRSGSWPATVVTQKQCEILFLPVQMIDLSNNHRDSDLAVRLLENMLRLLAAKAMNLRARIEVLTVNKMRGRISVFLLQQARSSGRNSFMVPMNRERMARYLNVSRPSMSRELGRMRDEGIIDFYQSSFTIFDRPAIMREAGVS